MSQPRLKNSERQKMLVDYVKNDIVPEGFYVKIMKNGNIQFRRVKQELNNEDINRKINFYETKINELKSKIKNEEAHCAEDK